jgi:hypothetical protein
MNWLKIYPWLSSPYLTVGVAVLGLGGIIWFFRRGEKVTQMRLFYFADVERLIQPLKVTDLTTQSVHTEGNRKFWRRAKSWLWKKGSNTFVCWLGKVGKGVTYRLETNKKDENGTVQVEKIGSLYEGLKACLNVQELNELTPQTFTPESLQLLKESEIFVCIDLEVDPDDVPEDFDEDNAVSEADRGMADLIGSQIKEKLTKEDWIRNAGLMSMGALGLFIAQTLGLI